MSRFLTYLSLGSNLGSRFENLIEALKRLKDEENRVLKISSVYETMPVGKENQPEFLNLVAKVKTFLSPFLFLALTQKIENQMGRVRKERWGPRIIDIDILFFDDLEIESEKLTIPHSRFKERAFVIVPLKEVLSDWSGELKFLENDKSFQPKVKKYPLSLEEKKRLNDLLEK